MSADSLIDRLSALKANTVAKGLGYNTAIDHCIAIILQHEADMGASVLCAAADTSAEIATREDARAEVPANTSEICDDLEIFDLICQALEDTDPSVDSQANAVLARIKPYLRTREPVSVSLEKCAKAADVEMNRQSLIGPPFNYNLIAKAVLDAAGVRYSE